MARSNITRTVTRAQEQAEREHNAGEARVCGGCRHYEDHYGCLWAAHIKIPQWLLRYREVDYLAGSDATECEAYEQK